MQIAGEKILRKMVDLASLASKHDTNLVEIYLLPPGVQASADDHVVDVAWTRPFAGPLFGNGTTQNMKNYHHRDMTYTYDLGNDGQRAVRKLAQHEAFERRLYAIAFMEETVPPHRFPSTRDMTFVEELKRSCYRINNRLFFVHDEDTEGRHYYYFRYQHAENVDLQKVQADLDRAVRKVMKV